MSVITLTLLLPGKTVPVQNWTFEAESVIRIGRAADNDVVLYSAVVSRHHLEIRKEGKQWLAVSLGINGTYIDGEEIVKDQKVVVSDGMIVRLASSGPKIQIHLEPEPSTGKTALSKLKQAQAVITKTPHDPTKETLIN